MNKNKKNIKIPEDMFDSKNWGHEDWIDDYNDEKPVWELWFVTILAVIAIIAVLFF